ncbi:tetratricopeptide repeat protein [Variovorax paradoxus]|nr:tetratricopeptide repeat protein [Variovorax paradoxus]
MVDSFLEEDHASIDPDLPDVLRTMAERRAGRSWHKHGSFKEHLYGTFRMLHLWGQPREIQYCGLLHSVYSNEYVDLALFDPGEGRPLLRGRVGAEIEEMVYLFCTMPRNQFVAELVQSEKTPRQGMLLSDGRGTEVRLSPQQVATFLVITVADFAEQWYSWQEDTMSGYPATGQVPTAPHWAASLWPGPLRPGSSGLSLVSRLARHLPAFDLPVPPIFSRCTCTLAPVDEAAACALYWQAAMLNVPLISSRAVLALLTEAIRLNPWVAEPRLLLSQLALIDGRFDEAGASAREGYRLLCTWGAQWDKRVSWQGWVIWARMLLQSARERSWPATLRQHNNLGFIRT